MGRCTPVECFFCDLCHGHSTKATNRFTDMGCDYCMCVCFGKPKSYAAPAGDPGIGLEQLELMCKV
ncbi:hypothetical protein Bca52824_049378 [Brassica carinata]|uniref:Uncharacterized protein n=1 Tax=Brassica carinata TaxID=52824 RepID=A0A8X7RIM7_BRACI|nr:hypothetical protein Bca52824_049378 [Brassica carinata]